MSYDLFRGHGSVSFEEHDLSASIPACAPFVAAALAQGWRLARDGAANHMDVVHGCRHLRDFKGASRHKLGRMIFFRFEHAVRIVEDEPFRVEQFIRRCVDDTAFFRAAQQHPRFAKTLALLKKHLFSSARHLLAEEPGAHDRKLIVPIAGGETDLIARLDRDYEGGF